MAVSLTERKGIHFLWSYCKKREDTLMNILFDSVSISLLRVKIT